MPAPEEMPGVDAARLVCARYANAPAMLLEILHDLQEEVGHIPEASQPVIADCLNLSKAEVHGVVSFYHDFKTAPGGKVIVKICQAEACQSMGAHALAHEVLTRHGVKMGETSADGIVFEPVYCLGNCALAPAAMVGETLLGRARGGDVDDAIREAVQ